MAYLSPKIEIINHFDNLIHRIDIDIEQRIEKYNENQVFGELNCSSFEGRYTWRSYLFEIEYFDSNDASEINEYESAIKWSGSTKVIDYLNEVREKTIEELRKAQEDSLEYLKSNLNHIKESKDVEEMKSRLFANKFYFQVLVKPNNYLKSWIFSIYTIVSDFYLSPSEINQFE